MLERRPCSCVSDRLVEPRVFHAVADALPVVQQRKAAFGTSMDPRVTSGSLAELIALLSFHALVRPGSEAQDPRHRIQHPECSSATLNAMPFRLMAQPMKAESKI
jgi:hypothetical protein